MGDDIQLFSLEAIKTPKGQINSDFGLETRALRGKCVLNLPARRVSRSGRESEITMARAQILARHGPAC